MLKIKKFTFNPFQENTFVIWDETLQCAIIDPGCYSQDEKTELVVFIEKNSLKPVKLLNTHAHIDHVFGNSFLSKKYNLVPLMHEDDLRTLKSVTSYASFVGVEIEPPPIPSEFLDLMLPLRFGNTSLQILFTPGHAPGHVSFYHADSHSVFSGDVLFYGSIGRFDLPGGNYEVLMKSIKDVLMALPDETTVYCGHGPDTTIGKERKTNPFVLEYLS